MISGIVFDMDGVLFDTENLALDSWKYAGEKLSINFSRELTIPTTGFNAKMTGEYLKENIGDFDYDKAMLYRQEYITSYIEKNGVPEKKGLKEILSYLSDKKILLAVATSADRQKAESFLNLAGIYRFFDSILCSDQIEKPKPAPDIYVKSCKKLGLKPENCLAVEDSYVGMKAAFDANMKPIMIPDLLPPNEDMERMAYAIFPDLLALKTLVR